MDALKSILFIGIVAVLSFILLIGQVNAGGDKVHADKAKGSAYQCQYNAPLTMDFNPTPCVKGK